jgi:KaiC/GvpD/RAD55 family RecA-like ATPase
MGTERTSIIVVDSLTVFGNSVLTRLEFEALKRSLDNRNRILIFIGEQNDSLWDRLADMVIELKSNTLFGEYFLRTINIQKARFQNHILGSHVIKIKGKNISLTSSEENDSASNNKIESGLFIYPSLHYHLSVAIERKKRLEENQQGIQNKSDNVLLKTGFNALDEALKGGIKRGTMTAISSNISYVARGIGMSFLAEGVKNGERSLYISLQDDPDSIIKLPANVDVGKMVLSTKLVIKSFRPGFISAEEFVDRIIQEILERPQDISDKTMKESNVRFQRVLFDDESQISLRFPLLEKAPVFLPTLMDIFKLYDMTALFLSTSISPGSLKNPPKNNLYDLVNTVIEVQESDPDSETEAVVRIRKIAEQFVVPPQLKLEIEQSAGGKISIEKA